MLAHLFQSEVFTIMFVIGLYLLNIKIYRAVRFALLHPVLITIVELIALLMWLGVPYPTFKEGSRMIHFMLGPSVVSLGYILYQQVAHLKQNAISIVIAITVGAAVGIGSIVGIGHLLGVNSSLIASLAPKSVTTPIAMELSGNNGGIPGLTTVIVVCAGIMGSIIGPPIMKLMKIKSPIAKGLAMGASSHGIGTAAAIQMGAIEGALSGLAIGIMGLLTSIFLPLFAKWFG
mgnify:FL=1